MRREGLPGFNLGITDHQPGVNLTQGNLFLGPARLVSGRGEL